MSFGCTMMSTLRFWRLKKLGAEVSLLAYLVSIGSALRSPRRMPAQLLGALYALISRC
jgi:hypothetical protein